MKKTTTLFIVATGLTTLVVYAAVQTAYDGWNSNGTNTVIDGYQAIAFGEDNEAYLESLAGGYDNVATLRAIAMGISNYSDGGSAAFGMGNYADDQALAVGSGNTVPNGGGAIGTNNNIPAGGSVALGYGNVAGMDDGDGYGNILIGRFNTAAPLGSYTEENILIGEGNSSGGVKAWAIGKGNIAQTETLTLGTYADPVTNASVIIGTGHGAGVGERENGLVVFKNGDVVIPKVQGDISMGDYQ